MVKGTPSFRPKFVPNFNKTDDNNSLLTISQSASLVVKNKNISIRLTIAPIIHNHLKRVVFGEYAFYAVNSSKNIFDVVT
jgi:hypothetical protein